VPTSAAAEVDSVGGNLSTALGHLGKARFSAVSNGIEPDPNCERSLISSIALSGSAVTSKFSLMRDGVTDPVRTALPR
jgi:hypothetical protein